MRMRHFLHFLKTAFPLLLLLAGIVGGVVLNSTKIYEFITRATGEKANITINIDSNLGSMPRPWRNIAQGGEGKDWRMTPIISRVKALHPQYIRIDHIYDFYDIVHKDGGSLSFHWGAFDAIINDILATGAKPYISLSYMPPAIAVNGNIVGKPEDWNEYSLVIQRTIEHLSRDRGITDVYYEVWNEPDLFGKWKTYGDTNYLTLYSAAAQGAARVQNAKTFKFGGPATTALYKNWFDDLTKFALSNNLRLDFFSWHRYSQNIEQFQNDVTQATTWMKNNPQLANMELNITEWGHDSENNKGYDTSYAAAHTAAVATELIDSITKAFVFELQDGQSPEGKTYWGRWGLFTNASVGSTAKPRYYALQLIDQIGNTRLQMLGKGTWVKGMAAKDNDVVSIVLANFDTAGLNSETVPVTLTNITAKTYTLDGSFLDGTRLSQTLQVQNGQLQFSVPMSPNSVVFLKLSPFSALKSIQQ